MKKVLNTDINKLNWRFNQIFLVSQKPGLLLCVNAYGVGDDSIAVKFGNLYQRDLASIPLNGVITHYHMLDNFCLKFTMRATPNEFKLITNH